MINGLHYLLTTEQTGGEYVSTYSQSEMDHLFSTGEQLDLQAGKPVIQPGRLGGIRYVDMVAAARQVSE